LSQLETRRWSANGPPFWRLDLGRVVLVQGAERAGRSAERALVVAGGQPVGTGQIRWRRKGAASGFCGGTFSPAHTPSRDCQGPKSMC